MTTLRFNFIEGARHSACRNDAFSIIDEDRAARGENPLLAIVPADEIPGATLNEKRENLRSAVWRWLPLPA